MKPCAAHRESVALLASSALSSAESGPVREHLQTCPTCREYFAQISAVCAEHAGTAAALPRVEVPPRMYHRVASALHSSSSPAKASGLVAWTMGRFQIAGVAVLLFAFLGSWSQFRPGPVPATVIRPVKSVPISVPRSEIGSPKLLAYRLALNRSPEAFEQLLTAGSAQPVQVPPLPVLRNLAHADSGWSAGL